MHESAVAAPEPLAVAAALKALDSGVNAIDAAVTCALVQSIVNPQRCGLGGYLTAMVHLTGEPSYASRIVDAPALGGSRSSATMWESEIIRPNPGGWGYFLRSRENDVGYRSICVPGTVKGLSALLEEYGTVTWSEAARSAISLANDGFEVDARLAQIWQEPAPYPEAFSPTEYLRSNQEAARIYLRPDGSPYAQGDILCNPDYGRTLDILGYHGPDDFYLGSIADVVAADMAGNDALIDRSDLTNYACRRPVAIRSRLGEHDVVTMPSPHGGPTLLQILKIMTSFDLQALGHNSPKYLDLLSMAMKAAFVDRHRYIGDPMFVPVPGQWLISDERASFWRDVIDSGQEISDPFAPEESRGTTHVSVVDLLGNCVALTHTLGICSGAITPGLGFMYNNGMFNFSPFSGHPNSIAPRKGRVTGQCPTIVFRGDSPMLIIGGVGASRIIGALAQVILNSLVFGMWIQEAVAAPRIDCQGGTVRCETGIPSDAYEFLRERRSTSRVPKRLAYIYAVNVGEDDVMSCAGD
jgi:gamma-glutamyltranspeptidase / glutathione hydrolase